MWEAQVDPSAGSIFHRELLDIKKDSFTRTAQVYVKLPATLPMGIGLRHKRGAAILGHEKKNRIGRVGGIASKIDARGQTLQKSPAEHRDTDMRGLQGAVGAGHSTGLNCLERAATISIRWHATVTTEKRVLYAFRRIFGVVIAAVSVRLPKLDHGVGNCETVAVEDTACKKETFAGRAIGRDLAE